MSKKKNNEIEEIADEIRAALKAEGAYSELLECAIEDYAQIRYMKSAALASIKSKKDLVVSEKTREGHTRVKISPTVGLVTSLVEQSRKMLIELGMTARTASAQEGDDVDELSKLVNGAKEGV
ncbi:P27 family phage terminase small subunit [Bacteroides sedimenti]|uniref:Phage terminase small subunit P27 family n=1 Tax=Bacteroides sedimenti TaxID=2136147 RepID=A0ABM8I9E3_9BACE